MWFPRPSFNRLELVLLVGSSGGKEGAVDYKRGIKLSEEHREVISIEFNVTTAGAVLCCLNPAHD